MSRLLNRSVELTLAKPKTFFIPYIAETVIRDLRVQFKISKKIGSKPNTCDITVSNLSEESRGEFERKPLVVRLDAGFDGVTERLFAGDLIHGESKLDRTTWLTKLQISDGARAYTHARVNRSFESGTSLRAALTEVANSMGLKLPVLTGSEFTQRFSSGVVLFGPAQREMTRLLKPYGFEWSIQDGRLQVLRANEARKNQAIRIAEDTGMIGSPEYGTPEKKGKAPKLKVRSLLKPSATPGGLIVVESVAINGTFRLSDVDHEGDTWGGDFVTVMEANKI